MRRLSVPFLAAAVFVALYGTQGREVGAMQHESRSIQLIVSDAAYALMEADLSYIIVD